VREVKKMALNDNQIKILNLIREGKNTLADFTDCLGIGAPEANRISEDMEIKGYIVKEGYTGIKRFNFLLTDKGIEQLPQQSEKDVELLTKFSINYTQYKILEFLKDRSEGALSKEIVDNLDIKSAELISDLRYLVDRGLLYEKGILRRRIFLSPKGQELIAKHA
jgi:DNA-binding MarR family transcriptional regulator